MSGKRHSIALFGGTFDPVHFGHLRMALELRQALGFDEMRLLPSHRPKHRETPGVSAAHRRQMLVLALEGCDELQLDERELNRPGPTYTVDTLEELRGELGEEVSISFCMGLDSLRTLPSWHRWDQLLKLAHLVVVTRPGWQLPTEGTTAADADKAVADILRRHTGRAGDLHSESRGRLVVREQTLLPISATHIRHLIASGQSPRYLLPAAVLQYIDDNQLYRKAAEGGR